MLYSRYFSSLLIPFLFSFFLSVKLLFSLSIHIIFFSLFSFTLFYSSKLIFISSHFFRPSHLFLVLCSFICISVSISSHLLRGFFSSTFTLSTSLFLSLIPSFFSVLLSFLSVSSLTISFFLFCLFLSPFLIYLLFLSMFHRLSFILLICLSVSLFIFSSSFSVDYIISLFLLFLCLYFITSHFPFLSFLAYLIIFIFHTLFFTLSIFLFPCGPQIFHFLFISPSFLYPFYIISFHPYFTIFICKRNLLSLLL